jgi:DNA mismatch repair protein MutL
MGRIRVLDDALADQIAAGEVVERPASIVRELLDNAIDAGATRIVVEVGGGGSELLRVTDDGEGMEPDDAVLALRRHATSKLRAFADLESLATLGFRGEALPSIASVGRLVLTTRTRTASGGTRVAVDGGGTPTLTQVGCAPGTSVEVRDLFYNVPARRKFLRAAATESAHIAEILVRAALAHPALHLELRRDGRVARAFLPAADLASRTRAVLELPTLAHLTGARDGVHVEALLDAPERARSGTTALHTFVNRRPVRERTLARAVAFAYGSVLPPGRFPTGVVHVTVVPREVDVNVHPQKAEVRFARGREVLDAVTRVLAHRLGTSAWGGPAARGQGFWAGRLSSGPRSDPTRADDGAQGTPRDGEPATPHDDANEGWALGEVAAQPHESDGAAQPHESDGAAQPHESDGAAVTPPGVAAAMHRAADTGTARTCTPGPDDHRTRVADATRVANETGIASSGHPESDVLRTPPTHDARPYTARDAATLLGVPAALLDGARAGATPALPTLEARGPFGSLRFLAQVRRMLLVCEGPDALHVIDQHAADERVQFHRLRRAYAARTVRTQPLLFPERVEVSAYEAALLDEARAEVLALGLDVTTLGTTTVAVHAVPALLRRAAPSRLVRDVVEQLAHTGGRGFGDAVDMAIATMACHGAIRAGDALAPEEGAALLRALDEIDDFAGHCPHGRPIVFSVPFTDLERRLGR